MSERSMSTHRLKTFPKSAASPWLGSKWTPLGMRAPLPQLRGTLKYILLLAGLGPSKSALEARKLEYDPCDLNTNEGKPA